MAVSLGSKALTFMVAKVQDSQVDRDVEVGWMSRDGMTLSGQGCVTKTGHTSWPSSTVGKKQQEAPGHIAGRPIVEAQSVEEHPGAHDGGKEFVVEDEENIASVGKQPWQRGGPPSRWCPLT